jgi:hypothetical protein
MLNIKYDPFGFKLSGWTESICNDDYYENILDEMYNKYLMTYETVIMMI